MANYYDKLRAQLDIGGTIDYDTPEITQDQIDQEAGAYDTGSKVQILAEKKHDKLNKLTTDNTYNKDKLLAMYDGDTVNTKNLGYIREVDPYGNRYDAVETKHGDNTYDMQGNDKNWLTKMFSGPSKSTYAMDRQREQVAQIFNKPVEQVTEQDMLDVANQQQIQKLADLARGEGEDRWIAPLIQGSTQVDLAPTDEAGNLIPLDIQIQSKKLQDIGVRGGAALGNRAGEEVTAKAAIDPLQNAFATTPTLDALIARENKDTDGALGEFIDHTQSSVVATGAGVANQLIDVLTPKELEDTETFKDLKAITSKWADMDFTNKEFGVNEKNAKAAHKELEDIKKKDYDSEWERFADSVVSTVKHWDVHLGGSMGEIAALAVANNPIGMAVSFSALALKRSGERYDEYVEKYNKEPDAEWIAKSVIADFANLGMEKVALKAVGSVYKGKNLEGLGVGLVTGTLQEVSEGKTDKALLAEEDTTFKERYSEWTPEDTTTAGTGFGMEASMLGAGKAAGVAKDKLSGYSSEQIKKVIEKRKTKDEEEANKGDIYSNFKAKMEKTNVTGEELRSIKADLMYMKGNLKEGDTAGYKEYRKMEEQFVNKSTEFMERIKAQGVGKTFGANPQEIQFYLDQATEAKTDEEAEELLTALVNDNELKKEYGISEEMLEKVANTVRMTRQGVLKEGLDELRAKVEYFEKEASTTRGDVIDRGFFTSKNFFEGMTTQFNKAMAGDRDALDNISKFTGYETKKAEDLDNLVSEITNNIGNKIREIARERGIDEETALKGVAYATGLTSKKSGAEIPAREMYTTYIPAAAKMFGLDYRKGMSTEELNALGYEAQKVYQDSELGELLEDSTSKGYANPYIGVNDGKFIQKNFGVVADMLGDPRIPVSKASQVANEVKEEIKAMEAVLKQVSEGYEAINEFKMALETVGIDTGATKEGVKTEETAEEEKPVKTQEDLDRLKKFADKKINEGMNPEKVLTIMDSQIAGNKEYTTEQKAELAEHIRKQIPEEQKVEEETSSEEQTTETEEEPIKKSKKVEALEWLIDKYNRGSTVQSLYKHIRDSKYLEEEKNELKADLDSHVAFQEDLEDTVENRRKQLEIEKARVRVFRRNIKESKKTSESNNKVIKKIIDNQGRVINLLKKLTGNISEVKEKYNKKIDEAKKDYQEAWGSRSEIRELSERNKKLYREAQLLERSKEEELQRLVKLKDTEKNKKEIKELQKLINDLDGAISRIHSKYITANKEKIQELEKTAASKEEVKRLAEEKNRLIGEKNEKLGELRDRKERARAVSKKQRGRREQAEQVEEENRLVRDMFYEAKDVTYKEIKRIQDSRRSTKEVDKIVGKESVRVEYKDYKGSPTLNLKTIYKTKLGSALSGASVSEFGSSIKSYANKVTKVLQSHVVSNNDIKNNRELSDKIATRIDMARPLIMDKEGNVHENVALALDIATVNVLDNAYKGAATMDVDTVESYYGVDRDEISADQMQKLIDAGIPMKYLVEDIGKATRRLLGIKIIDENNVDNRRSKAAKEMAQRIDQSLGIHGLLAAQDRYGKGRNGLVKIDQTPFNEMSKLLGEKEDSNKDKVTVPMVKIQPAVIKTRKSVAMIEDVMELPDTVKRQSWNKKEKYPKREIEVKRNPLTKAPKEIQDAVKDYEDFEWHLKENDTVQKLLGLGRDKVMVLMGYKSDKEMEKMSFKKAQEAKGKNIGIASEVNELFDAYEKVQSGEQDNSMWIDWFVAKNMRMMMDSAGLNPQSKKLHRSLMYIDDMVSEIDKNNEKHVRQFNIGIAQAFGYSFDKKTPKSTQEKAKEILELDMDKVWKMAIEKGEREFEIDGVEIEVEELAHFIDGIEAVKEWQNSGDKFETKLLMEIDGRTNGASLKMLQLMLDGVSKENMEDLARTGVMVGDMSNKDILQLLGDKEIRDGYQELTAGTKPEEIVENLEKGMTDEKGAIKDLATNKLDVVVDGLKDAVGDLTTVDQGGYVSVTAEGRETGKYPYMTFWYGAGDNKIKQEMSGIIVDNMIESLVKESDKEKDINQRKGAEKVLSAYGIKVDANMKKAILEQDPNTIMVKVNGKNVSLYALLDGVVRESYGATLVNSLNDKFEDIVRINKQINGAMDVSFRLWEAEFNKRVKEVLESKKGITIDQIDKIVEELVDRFPIIKGAASESHVDGVAIFKQTLVKELDELMNSPFGKAGVQTNQDGKIVALQVSTVRKLIDKAGAAAGVIPIHAEDATIMARSAKNVLQIFDAKMLGVLQAEDSGYNYNKNMLETSLNWEYLKEVHNTLARSIKLGGEHIEVVMEELAVDDIELGEIVAGLEESVERHDRFIEHLKELKISMQHMGLNKESAYVYEPGKTKESKGIIDLIEDTDKNLLSKLGIDFEKMLEDC